MATLECAFTQHKESLGRGKAPEVEATHLVQATGLDTFRYKHSWLAQPPIVGYPLRTATPTKHKPNSP